MDDRGSSPNRLSAANLTLKSILSLGNHLTPVRRVSASLPKNELLAVIQKYDHLGLPLVIEGWHRNPSWSANVLNPDWLAKKYTEPLSVRNVYSRENQPMTIAELLSQYSAGKGYARPEDSERWYGKHLPFPPEWDDQLRILPSEVLPLGPGDTFAYVDRKDRPETICYLGIGDTYTPAHKRSLASTGQNLMVYTSPILSQESSSRGAKLGDVVGSGETSSFWFLTSLTDSDYAAQWLRDSLHQEIDLESHAVTLDEFKKADFPIYVCQQKLGDMVIVPPTSCHQVVNHGGMSLKVAWSRMPMSGIQMAILHELPVYRRVGRPEIYRVKHLVHRTIEQLTPRYRQLPKLERPYFRGLVQLMSEMHIEEYHPDYTKFLVETTNDLNFTCDCCSADIFQTYFECKKCTPPDEPDQFYTMCTTCYVEGRSCKCAEMAPRVLRPWPELLRIRNNAASVLGLPELTLQDYNTSAHLAIFKAAVLLCKQRKASASSGSEMIRRCSPPRNPEVGHLVSLIGLLRCPRCRVSLCYQYTLRLWLLHAAEAILMIHKDPSYQSYHSLHIQSRTRWKNAREGGCEMNRDIKIRLARAALLHGVCRPADPGRTRLGWYDDVTVAVDDWYEPSSDESSLDESSLAEESPEPETHQRKMSIDRCNDDSIPSKPVSIFKRVRSFDSAVSIHARKAPKTRKTNPQQNIEVQLPISTPRAPASTSRRPQMASSRTVAGPSTPPVVKDPTTEESDNGDWHAPGRGDHDPPRIIAPSSHSLPTSLDANRPQDPSLSETTLRLVADRQSQLRANNEQWAARMDDRRAEDQERERRLEARLVAQREEYRARELTQREEYQARELAVREEYRARERHMEGMLTAVREESREKERRTEGCHAAMLAFYRGKEQRLDQEVATLRERERWLEGQLRDRWNPPAAYLAAPPRDDHLPTSSAHYGLGHTAGLPATDSPPQPPYEDDLGNSLPPRLARISAMQSAVPFSCINP